MNLTKVVTAGFGIIAGVSAVAAPQYRALETAQSKGTQYLHFPEFGGAGTGGFASADFYAKKRGYGNLYVEVVRQPAPALEPYAELMSSVRDGFGRTMSRLPEVFDVSRQTLYNWLKGETPKPEHQTRIRELAAAAAVFAQLGFKPTSNALDRSLLEGKSFLELLHDGGNGRELAQKLVRVERRGEDARAKLDELLEGRTARPTRDDLGASALNEDA